MCGNREMPSYGSCQARLDKRLENKSSLVGGKGLMQWIILLLSYKMRRIEMNHKKTALNYVGFFSSGLPSSHDKFPKEIPL